MLPSSYFRLCDLSLQAPSSSIGLDHDTGLGLLDLRLHAGLAVLLLLLFSTDTLSLGGTQVLGSMGFSCLIDAVGHP